MISDVRSLKRLPTDLNYSLLDEKRTHRGLASTIAAQLCNTSCYLPRYPSSFVSPYFHVLFLKRDLPATVFVPTWRHENPPISHGGGKEIHQRVASTSEPHLPASRIYQRVASTSESHLRAISTKSKD